MADDPQWDPTLPKVPSAGAPGDPLAIANASMAATAQATQTTLDLGRKFLGSLGIGGGGGGGGGGNNTSPSRIPRVYGRQAVEYVIRRAGSQMGCRIHGAAARSMARAGVWKTAPTRWASTARG